MNASFEFTPQATEDLDAIWSFIAGDNRDAANRVEMEIVASCCRLAKRPLIWSQAAGHNAPAGALLDRPEVPQLCASSTALTPSHYRW
jgi:plasmid stabilization system protein ParE